MANYRPSLISYSCQAHQIYLYWIPRLLNLVSLCCIQVAKPHIYTILNVMHTDIRVMHMHMHTTNIIG